MQDFKKKLTVWYIKYSSFESFVPGIPTRSSSPEPCCGKSKCNRMTHYVTHFEHQGEIVMYA